MDDLSAASQGRDFGPEHQRLVRAAWLYYRENLTQAQIAQQLGASRPTVTRLLERARQTGIVTIDIDTTGLGGSELVEGLRERYGLQHVVIMPTLSPDAAEATNSRLAVEAAHYLREFLHPGAVIGVGWGDTVLRTLLALTRSALGGVTFATLTGGIDAYTSRMPGTANNGIAAYIRFAPAPLFASSPAVASTLRNERTVAGVLDLARSANATVIGIGEALPDAAILRDAGVSEAQLRRHRENGAIGDILGEWYDRQGTAVPTGLDAVRIGLTLDDLRGMTNVIGIAGGMHKSAAIRGALNGGYLHTLVTTEDVARSLVAD